MRLFLELRDKGACPPQRRLVIIDAEEQKEAVAGRPVAGTHQGRMVLDTPLVKAEQHGSIRVEELTKVAMGRRRRALAEQRLVPLEAPWHIAHPDDRPSALHRTSGGPTILAFNGGRERERSDRRARQSATGG
jgi:hypothetical protein